MFQICDIFSNENLVKFSSQLIVCTCFGDLHRVGVPWSDTKSLFLKYLYNNYIQKSQSMGMEPSNST